MLRRRLFLRRSLAGLSCAWIYHTTSALGNDAAQTLVDFGLKRQRDGTWLLPEEKRIRDLLAGLPQLRDSIQVLERDLAERVKQNSQAFELAKPAIAALQQTLSRLAAGDPKRRPIEQQLAAERRKATPPEKLGGQGNVRAMIVQLSQQRIDLTLRLLTLRREVPDLLASYARLSKEGAVVAAMQELGPGNRLGPLRPLEPELRRLADFDSLVFTAHVPIWLQSGHVRFTAIVNEQQPLTLSWNEYPQHGLVLTASAAQALEARPPDGSEKRSLAFPNGRKVNAQRTTVGSLRLGRSVLPDVPAWVLASEGEDLGSQLDSTALNGYIARCQPAALRLTLQSRE